MSRDRHWHLFADLLAEAHARLGGRLLTAEIGVWDGRFSTHLLNRFQNLHAVLIDPWKASPAYVQSLAEATRGKVLRQRDFDRALRQARSRVATFPGRYTILMIDSQTALQAVGDGTLTGVWIDGDHEEEAVYRDIVTWWHKVRPGGIVAGHDFRNPKHPGVKRAVLRWTAETGTPYATSGMPQFAWWMEKPR